jgi:hypothetical protein
MGERICEGCTYWYRTSIAHNEGECHCTQSWDLREGTDSCGDWADEPFVWIKENETD